MNSWLHNSERLLRGRERCTLQIHPDDARRLGLRDGDAARLSTEAGELVAPVELSDRLMPGVVSLPHGWGHDLPGVGLGVASRRPGVNANRLLAARDVDAPSGASVLNGVPVTVESASTTP
jgi:anaerobic selenocysteine-containing dehydrogenase